MSQVSEIIEWHGKEYSRAKLLRGGTYCSECKTKVIFIVQTNYTSDGWSPRVKLHCYDNNHLIHSFSSMHKYNLWKISPVRRKELME